MKPDVNQFNALLSQFYPGVVGIEVTRAEPGYSECHVDVHEKLMNPGGVVHGGVPFALADTGMGVATIAQHGTGVKPVTVDMRMTYYKAAREGRLICKTKIVRETRRLVFLESEIFNADDEPIAKASASFYLPGN